MKDDEFAKIVAAVADAYLAYMHDDEAMYPDNVMEACERLHRAVEREPLRDLPEDTDDTLA